MNVGQELKGEIGQSLVSEGKIEILSSPPQCTSKCSQCIPCKPVIVVLHVVAAEYYWRFGDASLKKSCTRHELFLYKFKCLSFDKNKSLAVHKIYALLLLLELYIFQ